MNQPTPYEKTVMEQADAVIDKFFGRNAAIADLLAQIRAAEETHMACGMIVDICRDDLAHAVGVQKESRDALMKLRHQLIAIEKGGVQ